jgi:hypothetical protein
LLSLDQVGEILQTIKDCFVMQRSRWKPTRAHCRKNFLRCCARPG